VKFSRPHRGFTLVEVLLAAFILTLVSVGAMITTHRLCGFAKLEVERMVAASYCSDVYMRLLRMDGANANSNSTSTIRLLKSGNKLTYRMPQKTLATINGECILMRTGYDEPKCTIQGSKNFAGKISEDDLQVIIAIEWGPEFDKRTFAVTNLLFYGINNNGWADR